MPLDYVKGDLLRDDFVLWKHECRSELPQRKGVVNRKFDRRCPLTNPAFNGAYHPLDSSAAVFYNSAPLTTLDVTVPTATFPFAVKLKVHGGALFNEGGSSTQQTKGTKKQRSAG